MADKNIQMTQRNTANDGWDNLFPKTKASNVLAADGTNLEDHKINTTTAHGIGNKIDKSLLTQKGQIIYASAAGTLAVLNPGSDGQTIVYLNGVPTAGNVDTDVYIAGVDTTIFSGAVAYQKKGTTPRITATCAVSIPGTYRISFQLHASTSGGSYTAYGQIYVNGVAKGIQRSTQSSSYVTFTEDIHLNKGDTVALYVWCNTTTDGQYSAYAYAAGLTFTVGKGVVLSASDTSN